MPAIRCSPRRKNSATCVRARRATPRRPAPGPARSSPPSALDETAEERRLRTAACLVADIGWRAHPDYRGSQSLNIISNAAFIGVDHPGRAYLALSNYYRHMGLVEDAVSPRLVQLAPPRLLARAKALGAAFRVAFILSAAMPGILPDVKVGRLGGRLTMDLPPHLADLDGEVLQRRFRQLAKLAGLDTEIRRA